MRAMACREATAGERWLAETKLIAATQLAESSSPQVSDGLPMKLTAGERWLAETKLTAGERSLVDGTRLELATSALRTRRSPN